MRGKKAGSEVTIWGTGTPRREFLHVDDLADACVFLMKHYSDAMHINVGTGEDLSIASWRRWCAAIVHPAATIVYDTSKPDGTPRKLLDVSRLHALGWRHRMSLGEGIEHTYNWFLANHATARGISA